MQQRDKLKPILFSIIKHSSKEELKEQILGDIVAGIVVAVVALPLSIALASPRECRRNRASTPPLSLGSSSRSSAAAGADLGPHGGLRHHRGRHRGHRWY